MANFKDFWTRQAAERSGIKFVQNDEKAAYFSNDKPIIRRPEDKYYKEYNQNEQTGQLNREKEFAKQQKNRRLIAAAAQAQTELGVQGPLLSPQAGASEPTSALSPSNYRPGSLKDTSTLVSPYRPGSLKDTSTLVSPPTLKPRMYEDAIRRLNDRLTPQLAAQQKNRRLIAAAAQAQTELGVQSPAITPQAVVEQPNAPNKSPNTLDYSNSRRSSGWMGDDSPAKNRIDQDVKNYQRQRDRNEMTSTQRKMVDNPVAPISSGPTTSRIAWAQARLNERMGDTTPEQRRYSFEVNNPNAKENLRRGLENAKQDKARKDDDIALFRLQKRGLENSSHGAAIQKRIRERNSYYSEAGVTAGAKQAGELAASVAASLPNSTPATQAAAAADATSRYIDDNQWRIGNENGKLPLLPGRNPIEKVSPYSIDTEHIRFRQEHQTQRQRNEEYQEFKNRVNPLPVQSREADAFAAQQVLEDMYKPSRDLQHDLDTDFRNRTPPTKSNKDQKTYNPKDTWFLSGGAPSTGAGNARFLPRRLVPVNPNSKDPAEREAFMRGRRNWSPT